MSAPDLTSVTGNYLTAVQKGFATTLNGAITNVATTITLNSVTGFTNGDSVFLWIDPGAATAELVFGIVTTATTQLTSAVRGVIGSGQAHNNGATVAQYVSSADHQAMRKHLLVQHNQDGTHKAITAPSLTTTGAVTAGSGLVMSAGAFQPTGSWDGWVAAGEAWTFASSTTITVPTDATTKYNYGDYIKITQSATVKYFVVVGVTTTVLTVSGLYGATVANSGISANAYSKGRNPQGVAGMLPLNPYKFGVYRNTAWTWGNNTFAKVVFDTKEFDTGNNFASGTFTAPIAGFYQLQSYIAGDQVSGGGMNIGLYKNGVLTKEGVQMVPSGNFSFGVRLGISVLMQLSANDTIEIYAYGSGQAGHVGIGEAYFSGFLVSAA